jgi:hypothetical protein
VRIVPVVAVIAILAGCGGGHSASTTSLGGQAKPCPLPTTLAERISGIKSLQRTDLAPTAALGLSCSTAFAGPNGELVLAVTEAPGGAGHLALVRRQHAGPGMKVVRVSGLGDEALQIGADFLAVRFGDTVATFETGFGSGGATVLTLAQLRALARAAPH